MKKHQLIAAFAVSSLIFSACTGTTPASSDTQNTSPKTPTQQKTQQLTSASKLNVQSYKKWMLSPAILKENEADWQSIGKEDCYGLMNSRTEGGDLLSTLIVDSATRSKLKLNTYTQEYVMALENKIVNYTHKNYNADLYAFSVCHLGEGVDAVAGWTFPQGKKATADDYNKNGDLLVIVNKDDVKTYDDIQTMNNTATGAEVYPCEGKIKDQNVLWACFQGLHHDEKDNITGSKMAEWTIPLNGGEVTKREYVELAS